MKHQEHVSHQLQQLCSALQGPAPRSQQAEIVPQPQPLALLSSAWSAASVQLAAAFAVGAAAAAVGMLAASRR